MTYGIMPHPPFALVVEKAIVNAIRAAIMLSAYYIPVLETRWARLNKCTPIAALRLQSFILCALCKAITVYQL